MAIYNYGLPVNYQYPVQQTVANTPITTNQHSNNNTGIIWVQGESGAKAYPVAPGNSVWMMDSESDNFYIKSVDISGVPMPLRIFSYSEVVQTQPTEVHTESFATQDDLENLRQELRQALEELKTPKRTTKKGAETDE